MTVVISFLLIAEAVKIIALLISALQRDSQDRALALLTSPYVPTRRIDGLQRLSHS